MRTKVNLGLAGFMLGTVALGIPVEKLTGSQLGQASKLAAESFKAEAGEALNAAVTHLTAGLSEEGAGAKVTVSYKDGAEAKTKEIACAVGEEGLACGKKPEAQEPNADTPPTRKWGGVQLGIAASSAADKFKTDHGAELDAAVIAVAIKKNIQGTAGKALVTYKDGEEVKSQEFFCHNHGPDEIDCH